MGARPVEIHVQAGSRTDQRHQDVRAWSQRPDRHHSAPFRDGRSQQIEYIAEYDREYPVTGTDEYDHLLLKRVDEFTAEAVLSHGDKVYGSARRRISPDGKTMTITFTRNLGGSGVPVTNVSVYRKEEE